MSRSVALLIGYGQTATARRIIVSSSQDVVRLTQESLGHSFFNRSDAVSLDGGSSSDTDDAALTYAWTQSSGPTATLSGANSAAPGFTAPHEDATLVFSLTVNDGTEDSAADTVAITVVVPDPQREALEAFHNAMGGSNWTNSANWLSDKPLN